MSNSHQTTAPTQTLTAQDSLQTFNRLLHELASLVEEVRGLTEAEKDNEQMNKVFEDLMDAMHGLSSNTVRLYQILEPKENPDRSIVKALPAQINAEKELKLIASKLTKSLAQQEILLANQQILLTQLGMEPLEFERNG